MKREPMPMFEGAPRRALLALTKSGRFVVRDARTLECVGTIPGSPPAHVALAVLAAAGYGTARWRGRIGPADRTVVPVEMPEAV